MINQQDQVVCIRSNSTVGRVVNHNDPNDVSIFTWPGARKGKIYTVNAVYKCSCGMIAVDVGITIPGELKRQKCKCGTYVYTSVWWHNADRFRPVDWNDCREELIEEVFETKKETETIKEPQYG